MYLFSAAVIFIVTTGTTCTNALPLTVGKNTMLTNIPMNYASPSTKVAQLTRNPDGNDSGTDLVFQTANVSVHNVREEKVQPKLDKNGVELLKSEIAPTEDGAPEPPIDFLDMNDVMDRYYPICEALLKKRLEEGESPTKVQVRAFDHNVRIAGSNNEELKNGAGSKVQFPIPLVHGDYTQVSAPKRLHDLAQSPKSNDVWRTRLQDGESLLDAEIVQEATDGKRRFALINVWRSIDPVHKVSCYPLASIDATTVSTDDLRTYQLHYVDRIGENYVVLAAPSDVSPQHKWIYFDKMTMNEALLIKQWDSFGDFASKGWRDVQNDDSDDSIKNKAPGPRGEPNCCTLSIHSACDYNPANVPPRKSIEVRCVCIWEPAKEE